MLKGRVGYPLAAPPPRGLAARSPCCVRKGPAISQTLCSQPTHGVLGGACSKCGAVGLYVAIITRMMQGNACVNEHT